MKGKLAEKAADAERAERACASLESQLSEAKKKSDDLAAEKNRLSEDLKTIKLDYNKMASKLADAKKNLEDETLKRIDLQNQLQTMQEEHKFENSILEQQLNETRTRKQIEIEEVDGR